MGISKGLAEFVVNTNYEDIPGYVLETQKKSVLDSIAITFGASTGRWVPGNGRTRS
ncbi:MAG: MmgE/PrpD family protein [Clostridiales bacterium]|nr:MmgE/PrpD family protein [Clostridiales bacterium]